ncbi:NAD(P)/FAD-dependent oxidoreductase [Bartonella sp. DGB2]|uniref:NAD(P)/FAD-dependent oxidoreductase n=1 Tax=Bartonella sp. DGB2 TaxID=3388426 RepID=UPI00398FCC60
MIYGQSLMPHGRSWYEDNIGARPIYPKLNEILTCSIAIVGGGYTGLSAAYHLAKAGQDVVLLETGRLGEGASGYNGGQLGTGLRHWVNDLEKYYGFERTKALFSLSEEAKADILGWHQCTEGGIDYCRGQLSLTHRKRLNRAYEAHIAHMLRYDYHDLHFMDKVETQMRLGSSFYHGGVYDAGTGHIQPLKLVVALGRAAAAAGAALYEQSSVKAIKREKGAFMLETSKGAVRAERVLLATNAYVLGRAYGADRYIMPIHSYIGATEPLLTSATLLPGGESVDDSRFVVRYFRKSFDKRLLFGGAESYNGKIPRDLGKRLYEQILEIYPQLRGVTLSHQWGGVVAITRERMPYIREIEPGMTYCGGYSGHGVMLANFVGKLYSEWVLGKRERFEQFRQLKISPLPGGSRFRQSLLFLALHWFAFLDHL